MHFHKKLIFEMVINNEGQRFSAFKVKLLLAGNQRTIIFSCSGVMIYLEIEFVAPIF